MQDVIEPRLLPLEDQTGVTGTAGGRTASDLSTFERTFFDVRVFHPNAPSYHSTPISTLYQIHEKEKMIKYNSRILTVEKGTFTPLVYTSFGGCSPQATAYHKRLAQLIAKKRNEDYHRVISHIRTRIRFSLLRSVLVALRGERGKKQTTPQSISSVAFNLTPMPCTMSVCNAGGRRSSLKKSRLWLPFLNVLFFMKIIIRIKFGSLVVGH